MKFGITQLNARADFSYYVNPKHSFDFGLTSILYRLHPGSFEPKGKESLVISDIIPAEQARESAIYFSEHYTPGDKLSIIAGIRYGYFQYLGPGEVRDYAPGQPKGEDTRTGTRQFEKGKVIKAYGDPELRLSLRYILSDHTSIKAGYNSARQYLHMLTNTTAIAPTDVWKLSDPNILPQKGDQFSLGIYRNFKSNTIETSVEVYYKRMKDYLDNKPGASLVMNHHLQTQVINTRGKAYGIELLIKKPGGKLNGWASYTYSRTLLKMDDPTVAEPVNKGRFYPASFDKPHDLVIAGNFRVNHRFSVSMNINYSTGRPITLPVGRYYYGGSQRVLYSDRNAYRIPDYFRTDLSMNIEGNHKLKQKTHNSWTIGVYNLTGRKNPYSVFFVSENGLINGYRLSIFGSIIPFVNFNIRF
jgi:outer membrane receptor protein involved in Fe transport